MILVIGNPADPVIERVTRLRSRRRVVRPRRRARYHDLRNRAEC